ncbi:MAG: helix-turn-helix transcriptional regulator [Acidobacteriota bacterium]
MEQSKRKRLEAAGWQVGSAADFLGLNHEETVYVELRVRLADALRMRRQSANLSQKAVAAAVKSSQSRVAKMEANDPSVSLDLLIRSLIALGTSLSEIGRIMGFEDQPIVTMHATAALGNTVLPGQPYLPSQAAENLPKQRNG